MDKLEPLQSFSFEGNFSQGWKLWLKHFDFYFTATEKDGKYGKVKTLVLLTCIGQKGRQIYEAFNSGSPDDEMGLASVLQKFSKYCNPRKNITILRHKFFKYRQHEGQNFHGFVTELKKHGSECEFETLRDYLIRDMIVCGANDNSLRERLLRESELILPKAMSAGHAAEEARKHAREILESNETIDLHKISKQSKSRSLNPAQATEIIQKCKFWENSHHRGKCLAYGKVCHNCNRKNHFKKCCPCNRKILHEIEKTETESPSADEYEFFLDTINLQKNPKNLVNISLIKMNPPIGTLLYLVMILQYLIKKVLVLNVMLSLSKV